LPQNGHGFSSLAMFGFLCYWIFKRVEHRRNGIVSAVSQAYESCIFEMVYVPVIYLLPACCVDHAADSLKHTFWNADHLTHFDSSFWDERSLEAASTHAKSFQPRHSPSGCAALVIVWGPSYILQRP